MLDYHYYESNGSCKEPIILLHGLGGNYGIFNKQIAEYKKEFDVLAINLPGHGKSPDTSSYQSPFSTNLVVNEVLTTMNKLNIEKAHVVGISLGSVVIHHMLQRAPDRVKSAVLGGCITRFTPLSLFLLHTGSLVKGFVPHMWLYKLFAHIMMPKSNHASSRRIFIREAAKMKRSNFLAWYKLAHEVRTTYKNVQKNSADIAKLYITGEEDHLFVKPLVRDTMNDESAQHLIIENCGHVCNVEKPRNFNTASIAFIRKNSSSSLPLHAAK
ncbi:alpha/beta hydrolase [Bacillus sp. NTK071]|uniref:alpha/beta fold hydrolase n=1 Tax=Bacillus sp. NTK071 TaxID=2802175 RepID=UPI001A8E9134|nr:alpha/beta hydrolase [Bacillus sp. NTK071]MBN8209085.1 alpha/beta hydrolase [Bacillus sp. NTK071]